MVTPDHKNVYAVNETGRANPGGVSAYSFNKHSGQLIFINKQPSGGDDPCHLSVSGDKKWAIIANYSGGSVSALPIKQDGSLGRYSQLIQDSGKSINKDRQEMAHVHEAVLSPDEKFVFTPDLGTDKVMSYHFNSKNKYPLIAGKPASIDVTPGSGPRHMAFSPNHKYAYVLEELAGAIAVYEYSSGKFKPVQTIITHPINYTGQPGSAELNFSADGKYLYASNRGDENTITVFSVATNTGKLTSLNYTITGGKAPRNFIIDPTGKYILVANQNSDNIVIFKRNKLTGLLSATGEQIKVPKPVCLQMIRE